jgi:hypothetical protein
MSEKVNEKAKQTWTAEQRQSRIDALKDELRQRKKMTKAELYRFALNHLQVSKRVIDEYMKELEFMGLIKCQDHMFKQPINYLNCLHEDLIIWKGKKTDELRNA